jgi:chemotaxis protein methyltransferase CheR
MNSRTGTSNVSARGKPVVPCCMATIDTDEYEFIRRLVYEHSRINLGPDKTELVSSRVNKRLRALRLPGYREYCALLRSTEGEDEMTDLLDVISTNVTDFFREPEHMRHLADVVLPEWQKANARPAGEVFRVWSAASSSGEEPYTLAIVLAEYFREHAPREWRVLGSDISTRMLDRAREGIYRQERVKLPKTEWLGRYFQRGMGDYAGSCRVKPLLRERVTFRHQNLMDWPYPFTDRFNVIFCRNVMIYFDRTTQEQLIGRLKDQLAPGGYLFVGHSESLVGLEHGLKSVRPSIYRKP